MPFNDRFPMLAVESYMQHYKSWWCLSSELLIFAPPPHYIIDNDYIDSSKRALEMDLFGRRKGITTVECSTQGRDDTLCILMSGFCNLYSYPWVFQTFPSPQKLSCGKKVLSSYHAYLFPVHLSVIFDDFSWWKNAFHLPIGSTDPIKLHEREQ